MRCEQIETLLSGYIDDALTQQQRQTVDVHLGECELCRQEVQSLRHVREDLQMMRMDDPPRDDLDRIAAGVFERCFGALGWTAGIVGAALLLGYALYEFITSPADAAIVKVGALTLMGGGLLLLGHKIAERRREFRTDRYKDVQR